MPCHCPLLCSALCLHSLPFCLPSLFPLSAPLCLTPLRPNLIPWRSLLQTQFRAFTLAFPQSESPRTPSTLQVQVSWRGLVLAPDTMTRARTILGNLNFYHPPDDSGILENFGRLQEVWEIPEFSDVPEIVDYVTIFC
jgi:hypothetical protein